MKKLLLLLIIIGFAFTECSEEAPLPFYEVVPVVEVTNAYFVAGYVDAVRLNTTLLIDGVETIQTWDLDMAARNMSGCTLLKWTGESIEHIVGTELLFTVQVLYDLTGDGVSGYTPIENFNDDNPIKNATWIRPYFEVRDRNKPSNKFLGIEEYSNPVDGEYQAPSVAWTVTDPNVVPSSGGQASPSTGARIASEQEECECIWTRVM